MDINAIKIVTSRNWFFYDMLLRIFAKEYNSKIIEFTDKISQIDSIANFELFKEEMNNVPNVKLGTSITVKRAYSENTLYGYATSLMTYAQIQPKDILYFPIVEHGIPVVSDFDLKRYYLNNSYIFQGKYAFKGWKENCRNKEAFSVGPLIHYCSSFYSEEKISEIKKKIGRTALVFLPHSSENNRIQFDVDNIVNTYLIQSNDTIDSVIVCVYCQDVNQISKEVLRDRNIQFVSAGFKLDNMFISRLKTIIEIADVVIYDTFSSSIGYSYYLGKRVIALIDEEQILRWKTKWGREASFKLEEIARLFPIINNYDEIEDKKKFIDKYWGISNIRDREYIRKIVEFNKTRIRKRLGF